MSAMSGEQRFSALRAENGEQILKMDFLKLKIE